MRQSPVRLLFLSSVASCSILELEYFAILLNELLGVAIQLVHDFLPDVDVQVDLDRFVGGVDLAGMGAIDNDPLAFAQPSDIEIRTSLPKTRSGKIVRRYLKAVELGQDPGDLSTLAD